MAPGGPQKISPTPPICRGPHHLGWVRTRGGGCPTRALLFGSVLFTVGLGLPLGIVAARLPRLSRLLTPVYDLIQTIPSFVYLISVAMILGLGRAVVPRLAL